MPALDSKAPFVFKRRDKRGIHVNAGQGVTPVLAISNGSFRPRAAMGNFRGHFVDSPEPQHLCSKLKIPESSRQAEVAAWSSSVN